LLAEEVSQDGVDQAGGAGASARLCVRDGFVHGGVGGHAVEEADLVEGDLQDLAQVRSQARQRDPRNRRQLGVEPRAVAQNAEHDLPQQVAVLRRQAARPPPEQRRRTAAALEHIPEDLDGPDAGGRCRARSHPRLNRPGGWTARAKSAPLTGLRPAR
jgi:hypothetical protein